MWRALDEAAKEEFVVLGKALEQAHLFTEKGARLPLCANVSFVGIAGTGLVTVHSLPQDEAEPALPACLQERLDAMKKEERAHKQLQEASNVCVEEILAGSMASSQPHKAIASMTASTDSAKSFNTVSSFPCSPTHTTYTSLPPVAAFSKNVYAHSWRMHGQFEKNWKQQAETIKHCDCAPLGHPPKCNGSVCLLSGVCWHTPQGRLLLNFEAMFIKALKGYCPPKSAARKLMQNNFLVLRIWSEKQSYWFHLSFCNLKDFRLALIPMSVCQSDFMSRWGVSLEVERHARWESSWQSFKTFDFGQRHTLQLWLLGASKTHRVKHINARKHRVRPYKEPHLFWTGAFVVDIESFPEVQELVSDRFFPLEDQDLDDDKKAGKKEKKTEATASGGAFGSNILGVEDFEKVLGRGLEHIPPSGAGTVHFATSMAEDLDQGLPVAKKYVWTEVGVQQMGEVQQMGACLESDGLMLQTDGLVYCIQEVPKAMIPI